MQTLLDFLEFLRPYGSHSYLVMFAILIACGFGLPMPEDVILISGGILASHGVTHFSGVVLVCMAGVLLGDGIVFSLGKYFGATIKKKALFRRLVSEARDARVRGIIQKYGEKVVFMARFMPGLRTPIFFTCGTYGVSLSRFILLDGFAALISVPLWVYVGFFFGQNLEELEHRIRQFQFGIYALLAAVMLTFVAGAYLKKRTLQTLPKQKPEA